MAYVTVPKDLTKIKSKMLFGLTKRQLVCFGSAALIGVPLFFLSKGSMGTTPAALCMILVMLPFFLFALYEKNGQTPEALLGNLIQCKFIRPKKRVYQTNNAYSALEKQAELERTVGRIASGAGKRGKGRRRLTRQERKQIEAVIRQARGDGKNHTVQALSLIRIWPSSSSSGLTPAPAKSELCRRAPPCSALCRQTGSRPCSSSTIKSPR